MSPASSYLSLGMYTFVIVMEGFTRHMLGLNASHIAITDEIVKPDLPYSSTSIMVMRYESLFLA